MNRKYYIKALTLLLSFFLSMSLFGCNNMVQSPLSDNNGGAKKWENLQTEVDQATDGDTIDLTSYVWQTSYSPAYEIIVPEGLSLKMLGRQMYDIRNISFLFMGSNSVVIEDLVLTNWLHESELGSPPLSVLHFLHGENYLELVGNSEITMLSSIDKLGCGAAIGVPEGVSLTIEGSGSISVYCGGGGGAGIGGGYKASSGSITISGGLLEVRGGVAYAYQTPPTQQKGSAAIGGGYGADGGVIIINGGKVAAKGGCGGAGIGGGYGGAGGAITINGGFVEAYSDEGGAGIGGGYGGAGGSITLVGGEVEAYSTQIDDSPFIYVEIPGPGPAIGDGYGGTGGSLSMSGGSLTAIGSGYPSHTAINCTIQLLPDWYTWRAGTLEALSTQSDWVLDSSESTFNNSKSFSFVQIAAY